MRCLLHRTESTDSTVYEESIIAPMKVPGNSVLVHAHILPDNCHAQGALPARIPTRPYNQWARPPKGNAYKAIVSLAACAVPRRERYLYLFPALPHAAALLLGAGVVAHPPVAALRGRRARHHRQQVRLHVCKFSNFHLLGGSNESNKMKKGTRTKNKVLI